MGLISFIFGLKEKYDNAQEKKRLRTAYPFTQDEAIAIIKRSKWVAAESGLGYTIYFYDTKEKKVFPACKTSYNENVLEELNEILTKHGSLQYTRYKTIRSSDVFYYEGYGDFTTHDKEADDYDIICSCYGF